jgi:rhamnulokinase
MSDKTYLAVDCGAESGRVMAGLWDGSRMRIEELHRFPTGITPIGDTKRWDITRIWGEVERGLTLAAKRFGDSIVSVGADSWGVDYALIDQAGDLIEQPWNYRDSRTHGMLEKVKARVSHEEIFAASGVQFMELNTLYQLLASQESDPSVLASADRFLMIPDYLHFKMCGARVGEFTNATTTQFFHPTTKTWSVELLHKLGLPTEMLPEVMQPGTKIGRLSPGLCQRTGLHAGVEVIAPATHDTGSAVAGVPGAATAGRGRLAYVSSGTWSLLGVELHEPDLSERAFKLNFTNEGGVDGTYRLLKNIMGLWIVQECRRAFAKGGSTSDYAGLVLAAEGAPAFRSLIDPDDTRFLSPPDMPEAISEFCRETGQPVPSNEGEFVRCALESLAIKYATVLNWLKEMTSSRISAVNIVGGGSRNRLLNQFTADACNRNVLAGPVEATVLGNVLVQARACGELGSLADIRRVAHDSSEVEEFRPADNSNWEEAEQRWRKLAFKHRVIGTVFR